ncbi:MAG TPA: NAD(P)/FAD-dependent oxidoreductase [Bryobacteraceae bacterium]|nr:NAD(P)/FAD-dependent oxidoreductase [Bryobacteraceae bacterium]
MARVDSDVVIIGAGASGLSAAAVLASAGKTVRCLEANHRVGGRILTIQDPFSPLPIELGAEFVHGLPAATWRLIQSAGLTTYEHTARARLIDRGKFLEETEAGKIGESALAAMLKSTKRGDESFEAFLKRSHLPAHAKAWARVFVEGFNAARKETISASALKKDAEAADEIEGGRAFRILAGYDSLIHHLLHSIPGHQTVISLNSVVERVEWRHKHVTVRFRSTLDNGISKIRCSQLIVTVPLGVLEAGAIAFDPEPKAIRDGARDLEFGQVYRVTFRFAEPFWESDERLKAIGFLISREPIFPTWWTTHPVISPLLTGWSAGPAAEPLLGLNKAAVITQALASLARILNRKIPSPLAAHLHDWHADPFFRGAYSYVPVNGMPARRFLGRPVEGTLFFAGEATDTTGAGGTVHGAVGSGLRAARQVLKNSAA